MIIRYGIFEIMVSELVSLLSKTLLDEILNKISDTKTVTYELILDILNDVNIDNYDEIIKKDIERLINIHLVIDNKDSSYIAIDFPLIKMLYVTEPTTCVLDKIKIDFPNINNLINNFRYIIQPLHSIINDKSHTNEVNKKILNHPNTQEYLLIEEHMMNILSRYLFKYINYLEYQILLLVLFKLSKIMINSSNSKMLGIVTVDEDITCDENNSHMCKWVYGIFDVSKPDLEKVMKLHINFLLKKYNNHNTKIQYEYISVLPTITKMST